MAETINLGIVGIKNMGEYNSQTSYEKLNVVTYQGSTYCALKNTVGNVPTNTEYWQLYAQKGGIGPQGPKPVKGEDYFTEEDITDIENELKPVISADVTTEVTSQLGSLTSATPLGASSMSDMTDTTRIYVLETDGHWYWYDGTSWVDGGVYQATEIPDESITPEKTTFTKRYNNFNPNAVTVGYKPWFDTSKTINDLVVASSSILSDIIKCEAGDIIRINHGSVKSSSDTSVSLNYGIIFYDVDGNCVSFTNFSNLTRTNFEIEAPANATQFRFNIHSGYVPNYATSVKCMINEELPAQYFDYNYVLIPTLTNPKKYKNINLYMPNRIYHKSGDTFKLLYENFLWDREIKNVYFRSNPFDNRKANRTLEKYYQYENLTTGLSDNLKIYDSETDQVIFNTAISVGTVNTSNLINPDSQKNLLIIGDSFIQAGTIVDYFADKLNQYGLTNINLIGKKQTNNGNHYQAMGGYTYYDYITSPSITGKENPFWNTSTSTVDFNKYVTDLGYSTLDYVYIHLGVNDLLDLTSAETLDTQIKALVNYIKTSFPDVKIIIDGLVRVSKLTPNHYNPDIWNREIFEYNKQIEKTCLELTNVFYSPVVITFNTEYGYPYRMESPYEGSTELVKVQTDYLHPYTAGYNMIAYQSLMCFLYNM